MKGRTRDEIDARGSHDIPESWQETFQCPADEWLQEVETTLDEADDGEAFEEEMPEHDPLHDETWDAEEPHHEAHAGEGLHYEAGEGEGLHHEAGEGEGLHHEAGGGEGEGLHHEAGEGEGLHHEAGGGEGEGLHHGAGEGEGLHDEAGEGEGLHDEDLDGEGLHHEAGGGEGEGLHDDAWDGEGLHHEAGGGEGEGLHDDGWDGEGLHHEAGGGEGEGLHDDGWDGEGLHHSAGEGEGLRHEAGEGEGLHDEAGEGEGGGSDPSSTSWTTETATPGSPWEHEEWPKIQWPGEKMRKPRASNRSNKVEDVKETLDDTREPSKARWGSAEIKWGPVTKIGLATFMQQAFGQEVDFHTFSLKDLILFVKKKSHLDLDGENVPHYVKSTIDYLSELWTTWNTDDADDIAYWLMETCLPQVGSIDSIVFHQPSLVSMYCYSPALKVNSQFSSHDLGGDGTLIFLLKTKHG